MPGNQDENSQNIKISALYNEYSLAPGGSTIILLQLSNHSENPDSYEISFGGIPESWAELSTQVVRLAPAQAGEITLTLHLPLPPLIQAGVYRLQVVAISQADSGQMAQAEISLRVAAFDGRGRVGVMMESTQFSAPPGGLTNVPILLLNQNQEPDNFWVSVEGLPANWLSTQTMTTRLEPGVTKEVKLLIQPPRSPASKAGRHSFKIKFTSELFPGDSVEVRCLLTIAVYSEYSAALQPDQMKAGAPAQIMVENSGNTDATFDLTWQSPENVLRFNALMSPSQSENTQQGSNPEPQAIQPDKPYPLRVSAGGVGSVDFRAQPVRRTLFGGEITNSYTVGVKPAGKVDPEGQAFQGQVTSRAWLPVWVLSTVLVILIGFFCLAAFQVGQTQYQNYKATVTAEYGIEVAVHGTQTKAAYETSIAATGQSPTQALTTTPPAKTPGPASPTAIPKKSPTPVGLPGMIAFESDRDGNPEIYVQNAKTMSVTRLTNNPAVDTQPAWSPNGSRLAFTSNRDGNNEIYLMNADGSGLINLSKNPSNDQTPTWSPDGTQVAFSSNRNGNWEIYVAALDGSALVNLTQNPAADQSPTWFKTGSKQKIAFATNRDGNFEIYAMKPDGTNQANLTKNPADDTFPAATKDGKRIAFVSYRDGNGDIFVMGSGGESPVNRTNNEADDLYPSWSPDGKWFAFSSNRGNLEIYVILGNGEDTTNFTNNPAADNFPAWH